MSSPDQHLVLSWQAQDDLTDILQYTLETWGERQMLIYRKVLNDGLLAICDNPLIGFSRTTVSERHRFFATGEHLIVYRVFETQVEVARILRGRMNIKQALTAQ